MKKFDVLFETFQNYVNEASTLTTDFEQNVKLLVQMLIDKGFLVPNEEKNEKTAEDMVKNLMRDQKDSKVKKIILANPEQDIPPFNINLSYEDNTDTVTATVIDPNNPAERKTFTNSRLTDNIFSEVVSYIETKVTQNLGPAEQAVNELPPAEGAGAQPGAGQSALPGMTPEPNPLGQPGAPQ
jgi:hypothetical protein